MGDFADGFGIALSPLGGSVMGTPWRSNAEFVLVVDGDELPESEV
jgi:hypothetical protein